MMKNYLFVLNTGQRNNSSSHCSETFRGKEFFMWDLEMKEDCILWDSRALRAALLCPTKALCPRSARQEFPTPGMRHISGSVPRVSHNTAFSRGAEQRCAGGEWTGFLSFLIPVELIAWPDTTYQLLNYSMEAYFLHGIQLLTLQACWLW